MSLRRSVMASCVVVGLLFLLLVGSLSAQDATSTTHVWEVFLRRDAAGGADQLTFVDVITGDETPVGISGERYTLVGNAVMYDDRVAHRVMLVYPDGQTSEHPSFNPAPKRAVSIGSFRKMARKSHGR